MTERSDFARLAGSGALQWLALALAMAALMYMDWGHDGLWFQGDAPRHAATGLFLADLLAALPAHPVDYALSYYARYPIITPLLYPPLLYAVEAIGFTLFGPSPWLAKGVVLASAAVLGAYTLVWGRRWIAPAAGWAGALLLLLPGMLLFANTVTPNVPSTALGFAALYHLRRWSDGDARRHCALFMGLGAAAVLTYYPAALALAVAVSWTCLAEKRSPKLTVLLLAGAALCTILLLGSLLPANLLRNRPMLAGLMSASGWGFYLRELPNLLGPSTLALALSGGVVAALRPLRRQEVARYGLALLVVLACLSVLPPKDSRYALLLLPFTALAVMLGVLACAEAVRAQPNALLAAGLVAAAGSAMAGWQKPMVPVVAGFEPLARYLAERGTGDAVLYAGRYDGVFGFHLRLADPHMRQRVVFAHKLLYRFDLDQGFERIEQPRVERAADVATVVAERCGCRWVAFEVREEKTLTASDRLLRRALDGPAFELIASFPLLAPSTIRVDLYRIKLAVTQSPPQDIAFPTFGERVYRSVEPLRPRH